MKTVQLPETRLSEPQCLTSKFWAGITLIQNKNSGNLMLIRGFCW